MRINIVLDILVAMGVGIALVLIAYLYDIIKKKYEENKKTNK